VAGAAKMAVEYVSLRLFKSHIERLVKSIGVDVRDYEVVAK